MQKVLCILFCCILGSFVYAGDWPRWRGSDGDGISKEVGLLKSWPSKGLSERWRVPLGKGYSGIVVVDGVLYTLFGDNNYEYCAAFEVETGKVRWKRRIGYLYTSSWGDGPRSTPTVHEGKIYCVGANGDLWCMRASDGKKQWKLNILSRYGVKNLGWGVSGSPFIYKDMLLYNVGANGKSIVAFNKETGAEIWGTGKDGAAYSTPIAVEIAGHPQVIFFTAAGAVGIDPDDKGKILWNYSWTTSYDVNASTPIFHDDHVFISSGYSSGASVFKVTKRGNGFYPKRVWKINDLKNHFSSSILVDGYVYGFHNAILKCVDFKTGDTQWSKRGFDKGSLVGVDGHMIILGEKGNLAIAELNPRKYVEKGAHEPFSSSTKCWTVPTVANGNLFIRSERELICLDLRG